MYESILQRYYDDKRRQKEDIKLQLSLLLSIHLNKATFLEDANRHLYFIIAIVLQDGIHNLRLSAFSQFLVTSINKQFELKYINLR